MTWKTSDFYWLQEISLEGGKGGTKLRSVFNVRNYSIWSCGILAKGRDCAVQLPDKIPALQQSVLSIVRIAGFLWYPCSVPSLTGFSLWKGQCFQSRQLFSTSQGCNLVVFTRMRPPVSGKFDCLIETWVWQGKGQKTAVDTRHQ